MVGEVTALKLEQSLEGQSDDKSPKEKADKTAMSHRNFKDVVHYKLLDIL